MDYAQEQADEIEALDSIYTGYFDKLTDAPPYTIRVAVDPEAAQERKGDSAEPVRLEIELPDTYPDVVPKIVVRYSHILPKHAKALTEHLETEAESLIGTVMVFSLVTAAKDWLESNNLSAAQDWGADADAEASEDASGAKKNKEGVLKGVVGVTPVTVESFTAWRAKLEQEEEAAKNMTAEMKERLLRPTGRQLFERDSSLYEDIDIGAEDPSLFEGEELPDSEEEEEEEDDSEDEAGAAVEDASLFKDLGDEDLPSDSDEDDPDYKP